MKFIKLTQVDGGTFHLNTLYLISMQGDKHATDLVLAHANAVVLVTESPEEILKLIEEAGQ